MNLLAIPMGALIGLSLGALGGGGSILTVPALVYVLGQSAHGATTASLVIVGLTSLAGMAAHARAGRVRLVDGLVFGALGTAGSLAGARLSAGVSSDVLLVAFAGLVLVAAAAMLLRLRRMPRTSGPGRNVGGLVAAPSAGSSEVATGSGTRPAHATARKWVRVVGAATVVGLLTGFFGVGGGFVVVPALVLALDFSMPEAVGTSLLVIAINSASALLGRLGTHVQLDWPLVGVFIAAAIAGSLAGNRVASVTRPERLTLAFTSLLVGVAVYTALRSVPNLV